MALNYILEAKTGAKLPKGGASFIEVDERMCKHFGVEPDPDLWFRNWENALGLGLAAGGFENIRKNYLLDDAELEVLDWLEANFTVFNWRN
jgi:hypothetical protein